MKEKLVYFPKKHGVTLLFHDWWWPWCPTRAFLRSVFGFGSLFYLIFLNFVENLVLRRKITHIPIVYDLNAHISIMGLILWLLLQYIEYMLLHSFSTVIRTTINLKTEAHSHAWVRVVRFKFHITSATVKWLHKNYNKRKIWKEDVKNNKERTLFQTIGSRNWPRKIDQEIENTG